jgi:hypothetical protein
MNSCKGNSGNEATRHKRRGIKRNSAEAYPPSHSELRRVRPTIYHCDKLQGILAKANKKGRGLIIFAAVFALIILCSLIGLKTELYAGNQDQDVITDEDCREFYSNRNEYFNHPEKITVSHILICHKESQGLKSSLTRQEAKERAEYIRKLVTPENFSILAKRFSMDNTRSSGGDLGDIQRGQVVPAFEKAAFNLDTGEISDVVETDFGYDIIYVTGKQEARATTFEEARESIKKELKEAKINARGVQESANIIPPKSKFQKFVKMGLDICTNDKGLPIVLLFSDPDCSHCKWIGKTFDTVVMEYVKRGLIEAHHYDIDTNDDLLTPDFETEIPLKYIKIKKQTDPDGLVPYFNFGCRYDRIGNGYTGQGDLKVEEREMLNTIDALLTEIEEARKLKQTP